MTINPTRGFPDGSVRAVNSPDGRFVSLRGGPSGGEQWASKDFLRIPCVAAAGNGGMVSKANPFGRTVLIGETRLYTRTVGGAVTADIGVAANGTTSSDTLLDGLSLNATGVFSSVLAADAGTNGRPRQTWGATQFVTMTASGAPTGFVGDLFVEVLDP